MNDRINKKNNQFGNQIKTSQMMLTALILTTVSSVSAQVPAQNAPPADSSFLWQAVIFLIVLGLAGVIVWSLKSKKQEPKAIAKAKPPAPRRTSKGTSLDVAKEMEWLRKSQKLGGKKENGLPSKRENVAASKYEFDAKREESNFAESAETPVEESNETRLPIFTVRRLEPARPFDALSISNDGALMDAIEQTYEESEEDAEVRELSVRILAAFRTRNSVEALSQIALYDVLASLRSKAVATLGEFDHESVFEPILLACADPTREVRAAAARGLTKLTFDRADAWTRIAESGEEGRTVSAARAAVESGFVDMSFERLIHQDRKYAYEAFALMALLINAGETEKIFNALENHRDLNVRRAVLHVIKITKDPSSLEKLYGLLEKDTLPIELREEVDRTVEEISVLTV